MSTAVMNQNVSQNAASNGSTTGNDVTGNGVTHNRITSDNFTPNEKAEPMIAMIEKTAESNGKVTGNENAVENSQSLTEHETTTLLFQLEQLWNTYLTKGLDVRHELGRTLNAALKSPLDRQPNGKEVMKKAASRLGIAESDLSRMRWFAHLFASVEELRAKHPDLTNWTKVKEELPRLIAKAKGIEPSEARTPTLAAAINSLRKSLDSLTSKLEGKELPRNHERRDELLEQLEKFAVAAASWLHVKVVVERA